MSGEKVTARVPDADSSSTYENPLVAEFADGLRAAVLAFAEIDDRERSAMSSEFASHLLFALDKQVSELLAERDIKVNQLTEAAAHFRRGLLDAMERVKRLQGERKDLQTGARTQFADAILPVADDIDAALHAMTDADDSVLWGIDAIRRKLESALESQGIVKIDALGKGFNVDEHEPIATKESSDYDVEFVEAVARNGYKDRETGKVLRPARVVIAKPPSEGADAQAIE